MTSFYTLEDLESTDPPEWMSKINSNQRTEQTKRSEQINFVTIVLAIIISWIIVAFWTRTLENLFYIKIGFDGESFWQSLLVATLITVFFIGLIFMLQNYSLLRQPTDPLQQRISRFGGLLGPDNFEEVPIAPPVN